MTFKPTNPNLFFSKNDPQDPRLGESAYQANMTTSEESKFYILGYPDDEGIKLNGGRTGAQFAPTKIRQFLYKMTPDSSTGNSLTARSLADLGDLTTDIKLADRHEAAANMVFSIAKTGKKWISWGGGHDYAYSDGAGFIKAYSANQIKPLVINFDAHLDVRTTDRGLNSGTAFIRLLNEFQQDFELVEMGLQPQCNSRFHWQWAKDQGARLISLEDCQSGGLRASLEKLKLQSSSDLKDKSFRKRPTWISLDIDAFSSSEAPGCSQSWATGFSIIEFLPALRFLIKELDVVGLGIYEVSPPLDQDDRTSKLAALISYHFIRETLKS